MNRIESLRDRILAAIALAALPGCAPSPVPKPADAVDAGPEAGSLPDAPDTSEAPDAAPDATPDGTAADAVDALADVTPVVDASADAPADVTAAIEADAEASPSEVVASDATATVDGSSPPGDAAADADPCDQIFTFLPKPAPPCGKPGSDSEGWDKRCLTGNQMLELAGPATTCDDFVPSATFCPGQGLSNMAIFGAVTVLPPAGCPAVELVLKDECGPMYPGCVSMQPTLEGDRCCFYLCTDPCKGRPLVLHSALRQAVLTPGDAWTAPPPPDAITDAHRSLLAQAWRQDALAEHASIASMQRFALELLTLGTDPALVRAAVEATRDEVDHTARCLDIAARLDGQAHQPGPLDLTGFTLRQGLADVAVAAVLEGCIGETLAAVQAATAARHAGPELARMLATIAEDESRHALLAWQCVADCLQRGGPAVRVAVERAFAAGLAMQPRQGDADALELVPAALRRQWGRLTRTEAARLDRATLAEVVAPCAERLLKRHRV